MSAWVVRPIARFGGGTKDFELPCGKPARAMEVKAAFPVSAGRKLDLVNGGRVVTVEGTSRQAVEMSNGELTQPLELILPEEGVYPPLEDRQCCLAREALMGVIHLGQEKLIFARVFGKETIGSCLLWFDSRGGFARASSFMLILYETTLPLDRLTGRDRHAILQLTSEKTAIGGGFSPMDQDLQ